MSQDQVDFPPHYARHPIQPTQFCATNKLDGFQWNIIKYVCRHDAKGNSDQDLAKAERYIQMYRKFLKGDPDFWKAEPNG